MAEDDEEDEDDDYTFGPRPKQEDNQAPMLSKFQEATTIDTIHI